MGNNAKLWLFILLLPFFAAVGYDLYANKYMDANILNRLESFDIDPSTYQASDLGYILIKHAPVLYDEARSMTGEEAWAQWVDPVLRLQTYVVTLVPPLALLIFLVLAAIAKNARMMSHKVGGRSETEKTPFIERNSSETFKYKRR